ncbi:hypothetical protein KTC96_01635 [Clostridium estertheticum]|nr:hypothetical protein [Clostridium estertheticum]WLC72482.1 hypothetical protein KTC96_01635 [Clostridium estertheticum]
MISSFSLLTVGLPIEGQVVPSLLVDISSGIIATSNIYIS